MIVPSYVDELAVKVEVGGKNREDDERHVC